MNAVQSGFDAHIVAPLQAVRDELFATYRARPGIVSAEEFAADKASLLRMLQDFQRDTHAPGVSTSASAPTPNSLPASSGASGGGAGALELVAGAQGGGAVDEAALLSGMQVRPWFGGISCH